MLLEEPFHNTRPVVCPISFNPLLGTHTPKQSLTAQHDTSASSQRCKAAAPEFPGEKRLF